MNFLKKLFNVLIIVIAAVLIVICLDLVLNRTVKTNYTDISSVDRTALSQISDVIVLFDEKYGDENVWSESYNLTEGSYVITRTLGLLKGTTYVINADMSDSIFAQRIEMPSKYGNLPVYRMAMCTPQMLSLFGSSGDNCVISVGDDEMYSIKYNSGSVSYSGMDSLETKFVTGSFDMLVNTEDTPTADNSVVYDTSSVDNVALTGLQYRIIDELLNCANRDEMNELIAEYVIVREEQLGGNRQLAHSQECIELTDGCRQHVLYNVSAELGENFTYFNKYKPDDIKFYSAFYYICTGQYQSDTNEYFNKLGNAYVGAALCEVLDKFNIIPDWREQLDGSTDEDFISQYSLIKEYYNENCVEYKDKSLEIIKKAYNYTEIESMASALAGNTSVV